MNQKTPDEGWQQLQETIDGFFDHILRKEKEIALMSAGRREAKIEQSGTKPISAKLRKSKRSSGELSGFLLNRTDVKPRCSTSP